MTREDRLTTPRLFLHLLPASILGNLHLQGESVLNQGNLSLFEDSEIVVGVVCTAGVNYKQCIHILDSEFRRMGYKTRTVGLSSLMDNLAISCGVGPLATNLSELDRIRARMKMGNELRQVTKTPEIMALAAIQDINHHRKSINSDEARPALGTVHILSTLKRPEEVEALRQVYGAGFFLLGLHDTEEGRLSYLVDQQGIDNQDARLLMTDDQDDHMPSGQLTRETYYLSDVFVSLEEKKYKQQVKRFVELLFSHPFHTPTRDEYSMFLAYATSLRSAQLGRQVGAAILSQLGDVVGLGCNEVPRPGGGQYWCEDEDDQRDHRAGVDSNDVQKQKIIWDLLERLGCASMELKDVKERLRGSLLSDITEFGRAMHAEMDAILSCARNGISVQGTTLYTTTFPCHNCARHILGAGVHRVVYIEPYAKSAALDLHVDGITIDTVSNEKKKNSTIKIGAKIPFESFVGVGPRRYGDLFPMNPNYGRKVERKSDGKVVDWPKLGKRPRLPMHPISYLQREILSVAELDDIIAEGRRRDGSQSTKQTIRGVPASPQRKRTRGQQLA
jgi:deoxycytidylate deaminase